MKISEAIEWIDNRMCWGRGRWTEHHQPIIDKSWQAGLMAIEALQNSQWIPTSKRLPEVGEWVLCQCRANIFEVLKLDNNRSWVKDAHHIYMSGFVLAWMPLPEPYKERTDETD